jgi:hypothetical protein
MNTSLLERYRDRIASVLTCYGRIVITGMLPGTCHAAGMTSFLKAHHIRIFDYPRFGEPLRGAYGRMPNSWRASSRRAAIIPVGARYLGHGSVLVVLGMA